MSVQMIDLSVEREREPLPTKEQIDAISDVEALEQLSEDVLEIITRIETDLEFRPGDDQWHARARSALSAHQICRKRVEQRLRRLQRGDKTVQVVSSDTKLEKQRLYAERVAAEKERALAKKDLARVQIMRERDAVRARIDSRALQVMHATSLGHAFMWAARKVLTPEQYDEILSFAFRNVERAARDLFPHAKKAEGVDEVGEQVRAQASQPNTHGE